MPRDFLLKLVSDLLHVQFWHVWHAKLDVAYRVVKKAEELFCMLVPLSDFTVMFEIFQYHSKNEACFGMPKLDVAYRVVKQAETFLYAGTTLSLIR